MSSSISGDLAMVGGTSALCRIYAPAADAELRPGQRVAARVLEMLPSGDVLRTFLAQSGLFTEHLLREALQNGTRTLTANQDHVVSDLRLLLGALTTAGQPVPDRRAARNRTGRMGPSRSVFSST